ncbi:MAG: hypothetical protein AB7I41_03350 [Candidatus Sericytochromatia bacterium]
MKMLFLFPVLAFSLMGCQVGLSNIPKSLTPNSFPFQITFEGSQSNIMVSTLAGTGQLGYQDGPAHQARFYYPRGLALDQEGNLLVADTLNHRIRKISTNGIVSTLAGTGKKGFQDGSADQAMFNRPTGLALDKVGNLYIADSFNHRIRKLTPDGTVSTFVGDGKINRTTSDILGILVYPECLVFDQNGTLYIGDNLDRIRKWDQTTMHNLIVNLKQFPTALVYSQSHLWSTGLGSEKTYKISLSDSEPILTDESAIENTTSKVVNGLRQNSFSRMITGQYHVSENEIVLADRGTNQIHLLAPRNTTRILAGQQEAGFVDGNASTAKFNGPYAVIGDGKNKLFIADSNNHAIRIISR